MIDKQFLTQIATKHQTTFRNIVREYLQHMFLSYFYQIKKSEFYFFKGGTALRLVFRSPRFSEDIDFTAKADFQTFEDILQEVLLLIEKEGIKTSIIESKPTTGGFFSSIGFTLFGEKIEIKTQASVRKKKEVKGEKMIVAPDYYPSYTVQILEAGQLFNEKIEALLDRAKMRDYFDLYFILRSGTKPDLLYKTIKDITHKVNLTTHDFRQLKDYLPKTFWPIIKDLKKILLQELKRV